MIKVPRRQFLKISGAIAAASCLRSIGLAAAADPKDEVGMLIDTSKCTGCRTCVTACKTWNGLPFEVNKLHLNREGRPRFSADQWIDVAYNPYKSQEDEASEGKMLFTRISCMHCRDAACVKVCPVGAIDHTSFGTVDIDTQRCIGCNYCIANCTFNVIGFNRARNIARKCTFCSDRLKKGQTPACAQACPTGTITFGTRSQIKPLAEARVETLKRQGALKANIYGLNEVGGLGIVYVLEKGLDNSDANYALPESPEVPVSAGFWSYIFKPVRFVLMTALAFGLWVNKGESQFDSE